MVLADRLNFRSAPTVRDDSNIIGYFNRDDNVEVVGYTPDRNWAMVGDNGVVVGYAAISDGRSQLLAGEGEAAQMRQERARQEAARIKSARERKAALARARQAEAARSAARAHPAATTGGTLAVKKVKTVTVAAATPCKSQVARTGDVTLRRQGCRLTDGTYRFT